MHLHYLSFALRAFRRNKSHFAITAIGLSLALGVSLLIISFINYEYSFEKSHENASRIYRIGGKWIDGDLIGNMAQVTHPLGPALKEAVPEVESQVRFYKLQNLTIGTTSNQEFKVSKLLMADPELFDIFTVPLVAGNPQVALEKPFSVVISQKLSKTLFGTENPLGKTITIRDTLIFTVTGLMKDLPLNTLINTDIFASYCSLSGMGVELNNWSDRSNNDAYTFVMLKENTNPTIINDRIPALLGSNMGAVRADKYHLKLEPLLDLHLAPGLERGLGLRGSQRDIYLLAGIGLLLILMACFNYINLSTARIYHRYRELVVRTVNGANRIQLLIQFLTESVLLTSMAMILGFIFYELSVPYLESYIGRALDVNLFNNRFVWIAAPILVFVVGVISGIYPALVLLRSRPKSISLSQLPSGSKKSKLRRVLVITQSIIAIGLIGFTVGIQQQINFTANMDHGFDYKSNVLIEFSDDATVPQKERLKNDLKQIGLNDLTLAFNVPGESIMRLATACPDGEDESKAQYFGIFSGDIDFSKTFDLRFISGKSLSDQSIAEMDDAVLLNELAVKKLGLENPVGTRLVTNMGLVTIAGVVRDFNALSLHNEMFPFIITKDNSYQRVLAIRLPENNSEPIVQKMQSIWASVFPNTPFKFQWLKDIMADEYSNDRKMMTLFSISSGISIFIACLGLLGLSSFVIERRTKEVGIRKSIGASVISIIKLLTGEFVILIMIAGLIAWPITDYAVKRWLEEFAFRIEYGWITFTWVVISVLIIAFSTIGFQVLKAARANPADILRTE